MEAHLALAIDHAPIAIWSAGKDGIVLMSEGAGLASMGVKPGQLVGQDVFARTGIIRRFPRPIDAH